MSVIYIAGLPRSGTTYLQSELLQYENVVALGEVSQTITAIKNIHEYGPKWRMKLNLKKQNYWNPETYPILLERIEKDSFWSVIKKKIEKTSDFESAIEIAYMSAKEMYPGHSIIDASKHLYHLQRVHNIRSIKRELKVILCIRDYRGWVHSIKKHRTRINIPQRGELVEIYKWYYSNKKLINYILSNFNSNHKVICYDKLVFNYPAIMNNLASFCEIKNSENNNYSLKFHEILGSQSFKRSAQQREFLYDSEWFPYVSSVFEKPVSKFNQRVYLKYSL